MPNTQALIGGQGMTFTRAYIPYPLCCPSRASMLTGEYMHNHGVRGNGGPFGGWERLVPHESNTIATQLQDDGYYNVHIGKYVNGYAIGPPLPAAGPRGLGRVVRKGLRGAALLQLLADREGGARRHPRADLLRRPDRRVPDRRAGRQGGRLHRRRGSAGDAVHDERLVQRPARSLRPGAAPPLHPVGRGAAEAAGLRREGPLRQAQVAAEAGAQAAGQEPEADDRVRAAAAAGAAALGGRGCGRHRRRALAGGPDRRHLHHLRLGQRVLQGRAPDRRRQVPGL